MIQEAGVLPQSQRYFFTPSSFAEKLFYYPTRIGHYFCDARYHFSYQTDIARQAGHHLNYMLFLVLQGSMRINIDGTDFVCSPYQAVLFDCKKPHEYLSTSNTEFYWLLFNGAQSDTLFNEIIQMRTPIFDAPDIMDVQLCLSRILSSCETGVRLGEHVYSELIYRTLCHLLAGENRVADDWDRLLERATAYMNQQCGAELSVRKVAAQFNVSSSYFSKRFKNRTGYSPYEYIVLRRLDQAKALLTTTSYTVKQIAYEAGYNSEENFIHSFKKKVGVSPSVFRQYPI